MRKFIGLTLFMAALAMSSAFASQTLISYIPDALRVGEGRLRVFMMDIYDAALFAPNGKWVQGEPLALQLTYLRDIEGIKIAERTIDEMREIGISDEEKLADWEKKMMAIFPNVSEGVVLTGILTPDDQTVFLQDGKEIGRVEDKAFGDAFFGIWLNENTSKPRLRKKLLGQYE